MLRRLGINPAELTHCLLNNCKRDYKNKDVIARLSNTISDRGALDAIISLLDDMEKEWQL